MQRARMETVWISPFRELTWVSPLKLVRFFLSFVISLASYSISNVVAKNNYLSFFLNSNVNAVSTCKVLNRMLVLDESHLLDKDKPIREIQVTYNNAKKRQYIQKLNNDVKYKFVCYVPDQNNKKLVETPIQFIIIRDTRLQDIIYVFCAILLVATLVLSLYCFLYICSYYPWGL